MADTPFADITDYQLEQICRSSRAAEERARAEHCRYDTGYRSIAVMLYETRHPGKNRHQVAEELGLTLGRVYGSDQAIRLLKRASPYAWLESSYCRHHFGRHIDSFAQEAAKYPAEPLIVAPTEERFREALAAPRRGEWGDRVGTAENYTGRQ